MHIPPSPQRPIPRLRFGFWPGLVLASALLAGGCKRDSTTSEPEPDTAASSAAARAPSAPGSAPSSGAGRPATPGSPARTTPDATNIELPAPPKPPELRAPEERVDPAKILAGYGFPAHQSLTALCGWRDFNPGGASWTVDLFTSPLPVAALRRDYIRRLGERGLEENTWTIPATGTIERQLSLLPPDELKKFARCEATPPAGSRTLILARRAR